MISERKALILKKPANPLLKRKKGKYMLSYYLNYARNSYEKAHMLIKALLLLHPMKLRNFDTLTNQVREMNTVCRNDLILSDFQHAFSKLIK